MSLARENETNASFALLQMRRTPPNMGWFLGNCERYGVTVNEVSVEKTCAGVVFLCLFHWYLSDTRTSDMEEESLDHSPRVISHR